MRYMLSIYVDPTAESGADMSEWWAYNQAAEKAGVLVGGDALEAPATATTVRLRSGERLLTDGPFAETREHLGGYMLIEAENLDQAIAFAERAPLARIGSIEVRPGREGPPR